LLKEFTMCGSFYMYGNIVYGTPTMQGRLWRWEQQRRAEVLAHGSAGAAGGNGPQTSSGLW